MLFKNITHYSIKLVPVLAVWGWHNAEDEASEEADRGEKEDEANRQGGSSQRCFH